MNSTDTFSATVDSEGRLLLPDEVLTRLGLRPGSRVVFDQEPNGIRIRRPLDHLAKLYLEPTTRCNLNCRMCMRRSWQGVVGDMADDTFGRIIAGLRTLPRLPTVFLGGFGEPLVHARIVDMVAELKQAHVPTVELITNGCLLDADLSGRLIEAGLDTLWVSIDGIRPESYADVRLGSLLSSILENVGTFKAVRREIQLSRMTPEDRSYYISGMRALRQTWYLPEPTPALGVVFVAMKRNIEDLPGMVSNLYKLGARRFLVTNVLPYTPALAEEMLYSDRLRVSQFPTLWSARLLLPSMDINEATGPALQAALRSFDSALFDADVSNVTRRCPFAEQGAMAINWKGEASPCLPLTHAHDEIFDNQRRHVDAHVIGRLAESPLEELWSNAEFVTLRRRLRSFDFGPCVSCKACSLPLGNEEDCREEVSPACGSCLWSEGLIRCP